MTCPSVIGYLSALEIQDRLPKKILSTSAAPWSKLFAPNLSLGTCHDFEIMKLCIPDMISHNFMNYFMFE